MKFLRFLDALRAPRPPAERKATAVAPLLVQFGGGNHPRLTPRRYDRLAEEGYQKNVIVSRCVRLIAQNAACVPWTVHEGRRGNRTRLFEHPLLSLLGRPNPMQGAAEFFETLYSQFLIAGNCYLEAPGPRDSAPVELWSLRPDRMQVVPGNDGVPRAYRYEIGGQAIDFPVDPMTGSGQVLHIKGFHPLDDWYGMSPLEAAALSVDQHNEAGRWNASLLQNSGRPSGALVYKPLHPDAADTLTEEQRMTLRRELEEYFTGTRNAGRPLVLEGGLDWREMSMSPKDMEFLAGKDVLAREIALAFHVPPQLVGIAGSLTFANFEQARLALYDDAVLPLLAHFRDELNGWLAPKFGAGIFIDFDLDAVEALAPRREKLWERVQASDFMTINEKRGVVGLPPLPGGDSLEETDRPAALRQASALVAKGGKR